jgi:hypothetical protein
VTTAAELLTDFLDALDVELEPGWAHRCLNREPCPGCLRNRLRDKARAVRRELAQVQAAAGAAP